MTAHLLEGTVTGQRIAVVGRLASMTRQQATELLLAKSAVVLERPDATATWIVAGEQNLASGGLNAVREQLDETTRAAVDAGRIEILTETDLWRRLGLFDGEQHLQQLYTPAMLAELLGISVSQVRGWQRKGLIRAVREVRRLPYFDFREVATGRRIQELLAAGVSLRAIEKQLVEVQRLFPHVQRPLAELPIVIEGKRLLVRQPEGLSETGGQLRFDFEEDERDATSANEQGSLTTESSRHILALAPNRSGKGENVRADNVATANEILKMAVELEDAEQLPEAAEMYRAAMAAGGPSAEVCFLLAELLYRLGDISGSRERYYMAIELNEDYVEARANLGCVLVEQGQLELGVAAFQGALAFHSEYADVHYHLARALDDLNQRPAADVHWRTFLDLSPETPWADEARERLAIL